MATVTLDVSPLPTHARGRRGRAARLHAGCAPAPPPSPAPPGSSTAAVGIALPFLPLALAGLAGWWLARAPAAGATAPDARRALDRRARPCIRFSRRRRPMHSVGATDCSGTASADGRGRHQRGAHAADRRRARDDVLLGSAATRRVGDRLDARRPRLGRDRRRLLPRRRAPNPAWTTTARLWDPTPSRSCDAVVELTRVAPDACELTIRPDAAARAVVVGPDAGAARPRPGRARRARRGAALARHPRRRRPASDAERLRRRSSPSRRTTAAVPQHGAAHDDRRTRRRTHGPPAGSASVRSGRALRSSAARSGVTAPSALMRTRPSTRAARHVAATARSAAAQRIGTASGVIGAGSSVSPIRNSSTAAAHERPSAIAHTMRLWPRPMSPHDEHVVEVRAEPRRRARRCPAR